MGIILGFLMSVVWIIKAIVKCNNEKNEENERLKEREYKIFESKILNELGLDNFNIFSYVDADITVKSRQALENYDDIKYFREDKEMLEKVEKTIKKKKNIANILEDFLKENKYIDNLHYPKLKIEINKFLNKTDAYTIRINYITSSGNNLAFQEIAITQDNIDKYKENPTLLMTKGEYNKFIKENQQQNLSQKQQKYYNNVNNIVDYANVNKDSLINKESREELDNLIGQLFDRTVNSIKKIKSLDSEEWIIIKNFMLTIKNETEKIINKNKQIVEYYESSNFLKVKKTCEVFMNSQKEFNEYINEKIQSISQLFGTRIIRNETVAQDEYNYIRPYKKTITPFTAYVSSTVFASAENNPLEYITKYFYTDKNLYPEQIKKLYQLVEELETLNEARQIIENYKIEYQEYLGDVPDFIMENDEAGFYSRLGFATINESILIVDYKFSYTSNGGSVQRSFTTPMKEETIIKLIKILENKLTISAFIKEQRTLMTKKLREFIKKRDNFTCCNCDNSTQIEPNLLLEIDHIIPVSKGGETTEDNLQTLCWKCNRAKSNKIIN